MDSTSLDLTAGTPWPLGATWDGHGVNFAVFSDHATGIDLCLFDANGTHQTHLLPLNMRTGNVWHGYLPGAAPGLVYGWRAHGPWNPQQGQCFNPHKLLLDPYAREVVGDFTWDERHFGYLPGQSDSIDTRDNAAIALKARVVDDTFDWGDDAPPAISRADTVIYELHVKGFSQQNPAVPEPLRGSYAGLGHAASIAHLKALGVTSLCLLPVHFAVDEQRLVEMGLRNYWGYNTLAFFAPATRLCSGVGGLSPRNEFRAMVKALHAQGLEVLLDVVFNHTAEGGAQGPTLSFRGLDNTSYYRLTPDQPAQYENHTGCGNTINIRHPRVLQLVLDSLRYWVSAMHVDGFRFDLAPVLARGDTGFDHQAAFFAAVAQDPVLCRTKLIAEPWDIGPQGYQLGQFPTGWMEWNDRFRKAIRAFWLHPASAELNLGEFAQRLCGSADIFQKRLRGPHESVNYVVAHDGFTLRDLVSYQHRHNVANGEDNRDGDGHHLSTNCGIEGPTDDPSINALRARLQRALIATTLLAQGTPMLCAGDEIGRSQGGNNNAYCQDSDISWLDWAQADAELMDFVSKVLTLRRTLQPLGNDWLSNNCEPSGPIRLHWRNALGEAMTPLAWNTPGACGLACLIQHSQAGFDTELFLLFNPLEQNLTFVLPSGTWHVLLDSALATSTNHWQGHGELTVRAHSLLVLGAQC